MHEDNHKNLIGPTLKERREELGYTLQDAEKKTRIRQIHLEHLEEDRFSLLPGKAYVSGFIRIYAQFLGLDSKFLLSQLDNYDFEPEGNKKLVKTSPNLQVIRKSKSYRTHWKKIIFLIVLVLVLGAAIFFVPSWFPTDDPLIDFTPQSIPLSEGEVEGKQSADRTPEAVRSEESTLDTQKSESVASGHIDGVENEDESPAGGAVFALIPSSGASLRMLSLSDSSLDIQIDGRDPHYYKLYKGLDLTWKVDKEAHVKLAQNDVARFWLNNKELDLENFDAFTLKAAPQ